MGSANDTMTLEYVGPRDGGYAAMVISPEYQSDKAVVEFVERETNLKGSWEFRVSNRIDKHYQHVWILTRE